MTVSRPGSICGSSHDIGDNVPFGNFRALAETLGSFKAQPGAS